MSKYVRLEWPDYQFLMDRDDWAEQTITIGDSDVLVPIEWIESENYQKTFLDKIHNIDLELLKEQKGFLVDIRELEKYKDDWDAYSGIIHLLDTITDYLEDKK